MLELNDPLWNKLNTVFRKERVPTLLSALAASWDDETANTLLWEELWHQQTCCGATYAAVPHLLKIAEPQETAISDWRSPYFSVRSRSTPIPVRILLITPRRENSRHCLKRSWAGRSGR
jgi:hypothetical protein